MRVSIYYNSAKCEQQDVILIKLNNSGRLGVEATWKECFILSGKEVYVNEGQAKSMPLAVGEAMI
ncbi:hypothetical protein [Pontibacter sp. 13R65]|uniref:hypothetical protein n=1 Tax=Pontibacter sp. 13R65 TaxID=3127458 RepID=UPI00301D4346